MFKFFRKIRSELLISNRLGKYLFYAFGEILLVVIGILLALQINNWNEKNKLNKAEQILLSDLQAEIYTNSLHIDSVINLNKLSMDCAIFLNDFYKYPQLIDDIPADSIMKCIFLLPGAVFKAESGILNSLISSGQINILNNKKLKYELAALNDTYKDKMMYSKFVQDLGNRYFDEKIYPGVVPVIINGRLTEFKHKKLFEIPEFSLAVQGVFIERRKVALKNENELKTELEQILKLIKIELGQAL